MIFRKSSIGGGGHFQSKNLSCRFWTFIKGLKRAFWKNCNMIIRNWGGVIGRVEFFRKFIRFGWRHPSLSTVHESQTQQTELSYQAIVTMDVFKTPFHPSISCGKINERQTLLTKSNNFKSTSIFCFLHVPGVWSSGSLSEGPRWFPDQRSLAQDFGTMRIERSNLKSKDGGAKEDRELARRCEPGNAACADEGLVTFDVEILVVVIIWASSSSSWLWPSSPLFSWWHLGNGDPKM